MLILAFALPLLAALLCMGLNRVVATRWCALGAAVALGLAALGLLSMRLRGVPTTVLDQPWFELVDQAIRITLRLDAIGYVAAIVSLWGGCLALLALGLALPGDLRGYGSLPATVAVMVGVTIVGIANTEPIIRPATWMVAALASAMMLWVSGAQEHADAPLIISLAGAVAMGLLFGCEVVRGRELLPADLRLLSLVVACLLMIGAAPFNAVAGALGAAPAGMNGAALACGLPLLGGLALLQILGAGSVSQQWRIALLLVGLGALLACAAGALRAVSMRRLVAWQHGALMGIFLIAVGVGDVGAALLLLICAGATTLAAALALALLERQAGTDDLRAASVRAPLWLPGLALLLAGAGAVGLPGTGSWWARIALMGDLADHGAVWALGLLLGGTGLLGLSYLAPLAACWRVRRGGEASVHHPQRSAEIVPLVAAAPLIVLGLGPQLVGGVGMGLAIQVLCLLIFALVIGCGLLLLHRMPAHTPVYDDDRVGGAVLPAGLGASLSGLAGLAAPAGALNAGWEALLQLSVLLTRTLRRVEDRYYLAGLTIALIVVILIFI